ncbi:hypothetical protein [Caproicibacter fermentans]|uniref:hypothetical protein n=1 Tax=Caproicibacter fermentans TaxID=2576756 RepID=UPI0009F493B4|nr:hypothetical protein [Caproicibacter fermentans]
MKSTFNVTLQTPIGPQRGVLAMEEERGILSGSIRAMGSTSFFKNGKIDFNAFEFSGVLNMGFFCTKYQVKGTLSGNALAAVATTGYGNFQISGTRVTGAASASPTP